MRRQPHHDEALQTDLPDGQITLSSTRLRIVACPVPFAKIFLFFRNRITCMILAVSSHWRGGSRSSQTRDGMRWTQAAPKTRAPLAGGEGVGALPPPACVKVARERRPTWPTSPGARESTQE